MLDNLELLRRIDSDTLAKLVDVLNHLEEIRYVNNTLVIKFKDNWPLNIRFVVEDKRDIELEKYHRPTPSLFPDISPEFKALLY